MDARVERAMARWPDVPAAYGWLSLDMRGRWRLDGGIVRNHATREAINRNYAVDERGCWYYQNGPQKAFAALEYTPWVYVLDGHQRLHTHTERAVGAVESVWIDEEMAVLLLTEYGIGVVSDQDVEVLLDCFCDSTGRLLDADDVEHRLTEPTLADPQLFLDWTGLVPIQRIARATAPSRFGFNPQPVAMSSAPREPT